MLALATLASDISKFLCFYTVTVTTFFPTIYPQFCQINNLSLKVVNAYSTLDLLSAQLASRSPLIVNLLTVKTTSHLKKYLLYFNIRIWLLIHADLFYYPVDDIC